VDAVELLLRYGGGSPAIPARTRAHTSFLANKNQNIEKDSRQDSVVCFILNYFANLNLKQCTKVITVPKVDPMDNDTFAQFVDIVTKK
jgi:hypothetical protein